VLLIAAERAAAAAAAAAAGELERLLLRRRRRERERAQRQAVRALAPEASCEGPYTRPLTVCSYNTGVHTSHDRMLIQYRYTRTRTRSPYPQVHLRTTSKQSGSTGTLDSPVHWVHRIRW
jgi:hypothetical protein